LLIQHRVPLAQPSVEFRDAHIRKSEEIELLYNEVFETKLEALKLARRERNSARKKKKKKEKKKKEKKDKKKKEKKKSFETCIQWHAVSVCFCTSIK
jgi:methionine-rich copper-binding protein CopC